MKSSNGTTLYVEDDAYFKPLKKRYCGNRLSKTSYILLMTLIVIIVIVLVCGLTLYFAIIPTMIRVRSDLVEISQTFLKSEIPKMGLIL